MILKVNKFRNNGVLLYFEAKPLRSPTSAP